MDTKKASSQITIALRVSWNTIVLNVALSAFKLLAGVFAHSAAMLSDAVHSLSDVLSTIIVMIGVKLANKQSDKEHPYGHERMECVAAIILAVILAATGAMIGWDGVGKVMAGGQGGLAIPGRLALVAAVVSILTKEAMYWYTRAAAKETGSGALMADAWHHRSDALSSIGSFIGVLGARLGMPILDPVACILICLFILKAAYDIFMDAVGKMTDRACDDATIAEIHKAILSEKSVVRIDNVKTRLFGDRCYVDVEIALDGGATLAEAHHTAQRVHDEIEGRIPKVKHCMVHVNPVGARGAE